MNSVERVKAICKEKKIPISKLEKMLGYGNGYISQLRKGEFPASRLVEIAATLGVSRDYILTGEEKNTPTVAGKRASDDMQLSAAELDLIRKFRKLDERGKSAVLNVLDHEYAALPGDTSVSRRQA